MALIVGIERTGNVGVKYSTITVAHGKKNLWSNEKGNYKVGMNGNTDERKGAPIGDGGKN